MSVSTYPGFTVTTAKPCSRRSMASERVIMLSDAAHDGGDLQDDGGTLRVSRELQARQ
ncbi:hypothetical protein PC119_g10321 [Phytophthora cactorum]|uniref:Uncharacterized protein n=1 Tax=Phytophthora cactorum TaxID=29920 RepID=A0A8T0Z4W1_9STRA|nr:hypothetical protein PC113_g10989 [Phytophthora cactorum]KAG2886717.1 hypothetical protein PC114_g19123 [Phytophthora cactorum]KAG2940144.1 hypothetical protein PC117_g10638 [Phytophthora cactorum]KAG3019446.1 hypothetical protein PC119_g10321 [Phytophthora cactorum]KAG3064840.1 hypothetical protein PC122_g18382 [Phytophthora cactorum]